MRAFDTNREAKPLKSMLVLHGLSSDANSYIRYTSIERYANDHQLAIIMPNADHSFYTNMVYGHSYYDYILEVHDYVHQILPLSKKREDNFIAGHSMGGYGTSKYALTQSQRFSKAAMLSAAFNVHYLESMSIMTFVQKPLLVKMRTSKVRLSILIT